MYCINSESVSPAHASLFCALHLRVCGRISSSSLKYHNLNPEYIHDRLKSLGKSYELVVLLVLVDVVGVGRLGAIANIQTVNSLKVCSYRKIPITPLRNWRKWLFYPKSLLYRLGGKTGFSSECDLQLADYAVRCLSSHCACYGTQCNKILLLRTVFVGFSWLLIPWKLTDGAGISFKEL